MGTGCTGYKCKEKICVKMQCGHHVCPNHVRQQVIPNCHKDNILKCNTCGINKVIAKILYPCGCIETQIQRFKAYTIIENNCIKEMCFECKNHHITKIKDYFFINDETTQLLISDLLIVIQQSKIIKADLSNTYIGDKGAKAIASILDKNTSLTSLNLDYNNIGVEGVKAIAKILETNTSLTLLGLKYNSFRDEGANAIAKTLEINISLKSVNLRFNNIGVEGAKAIAKALEINISLTSLNLDFNNVGVEGVNSIAKMLEANTSLTSLNLKYNNIGDEGAKAIAKALEINISLTSLSLKFNNIGGEGAKAITKALETNISLTSLNLENNNIRVEQKEIIDAFLERNIEKPEEKKEVKKQNLTMLLKGNKARKIEVAFRENYFTEILKQKSGTIAKIAKNVYLIEYSNGEKNILKTYEFRKADEDENDGIERVKNEYNISVKWGELSKNIVKGIHIKEAEIKDKLYIEKLYEFGGLSLFDLTMNCGISAEKILEWAKQSISGFAKAEEHGIYHSDIKPQNMVWQNDTLKIIDFGCSISMTSMAQLLHFTANKIKDETEVYIPPELIKNVDSFYDIKFDHNKSDVYSWGMSFYHIITKASMEELIDDREKYKMGDGKDYEGFMHKVGNIKMIGANGAVIQEHFRKILLVVLDFEPSKRPTFKHLTSMISNVKLP